ncbi:sugar ABC transporter substrate-binding protein [Paenibacillus glycanilyticus]|uniref:ABC transporter substrate-binding protein n=1 Tax=Paenibacillus glycanilyticus TaxID=126569 RepID=UPI00203B4EFA|nr:sugar ABC transporter substrate-binding protein [Paenibacillus glycanilyticus]MCM3626906.1 sugar ABC transporter substrate-binding protein [Paenibacillus glycanilyticus]
MKRFSRAMGMIVSVMMVLSVMAACSGNNGNSGGNNKPAESNAATNATQSETEDYTFGEDITFHSNEPVKYSMMYSDHEAYPYKEDWRLWSAIKEKTNVEFDLATTARTEYENQKSLLVNSGDAPYIIPKTYEEGAFVAGGQIVPISDYVQYMPNFQKAVKNWGMEEDLKVKMQADGKYYVLPGLWEAPGGGYSYIIRKDIFEKAGVDLSKEATWTYEDFYAAMKKVKEFTGKKYVFSDEFKGESTLNIAAVEYGVTAGWGKANGMRFNHDTNQFEFANNTQDFKDFVSYFNKLITEGIMDPESFTQEDDAAKSKFFKGDTFVLNGNYQLLADYQTKMEDPNAELYMITQPGGPKGQLMVETSRLENGIMISQNALKDLGEEKFIKMLRFVDWLWYSEEGQTLSLWGVEGETYTKDASGNITLNPDITYNGMNPTAAKKLNADYGFGGGVFAYGGTSKLRMSKMTEGEKDFVSRVLNNREPRKLAPPIMGTADESEQLNLISKPLMDFVSTMTLKFITGQEKLENYDNYVKQVQANGSDRYAQMANEIFGKTKSVLGY